MSDRLFSTTEDHFLFPNMHVEAFQENSEAKFEFLGLITGKLIYESMVTELPLAGRLSFVVNSYLLLIFFYDQRSSELFLKFMNSPLMTNKSIILYYHWPP
jgi:hypothetical protein